mmetsp:Transcript_6196/g.16468  ORF Transcript_6196/g.16468 Transcript_6196/m.16468 type:complete len:266 (-) Transcript_6196:58-855(-)
MAGRRIVVVAGFLGVAAGIATVSRDSTGSRSSVTKDADGNVTHSLMICNAYASPKSLDVYSLTKEMKLTVEPLPYKGCREMSLELEEGERLDFKLGGLSVGTFRAAGLPYTPSNLLLVPFHKDTKTMSAAFASHAFSSLEGSQVAVIDAYVGSVNNTMFIQTKSRSNRLSGELKAGASISIPPREYTVSINNEKGKRLKERKLDAAANTRYVVMRVGSEADGHEEDLVLSAATGSDFARDGSGSLRSGLGAVALLAAAVAALAAA